MSRIVGKEYKRFTDVYYGLLRFDPEMPDYEHEMETFSKLFEAALREFQPLNTWKEWTLKDFAWLMWKYGFAYDYPDDEDYKEIKD